MNCKQCNAKLVEKQVVCHKCGAILRLPDCKTQEAQNLLRENAGILSRAIQYQPDVDRIQDKAVQRYARAAARARHVLKTPVMSQAVNGSGVSGRKSTAIESIEKFQSRCRDGEFHIALIGAIKAGKSTLMNALLDTELASTEVTPETASLTKFRASKGKHYAKVTFYTTSEWSACWKSAQESNAKIFREEYESLQGDAHKGKWLNKEPYQKECDSIDELKEEIRRWTSSKSPEHYFVKEVEVGVHGIQLPAEVVFVDTPGLDDVVQYRSDITRSYIDRANAVLVCVNATTLRGEELKTIGNVFANTRYNPEKVFILATQIDRMNSPRKDWKKQQAEWLKYLKDDSCYGSRELAEKNLIPVSAYLYTMLRKKDLTEDEKFDLASMLLKYRIHMRDLPDHIRDLMDETNIEKLRYRLREDIVMKCREILRADVAEHYKALRDDLKPRLREIQQTQNHIVETSRKKLEDIVKEKQESERQLAEQQQALEQLKHQRKEMERQLDNQLKQLKDAIANMGVR